MDLRQAVQLVELKRQKREAVKLQERSVKTIAATALRLMASAEEQFDGTSNDFQRKWLSSQSFVLMEIPTSSVSVLRTNKAAVIKALQACADDQAIIVDVNKRGLGSSFMGFMPKVVVVEGQTKHAVAAIRGQSYIKAWVGRKAIKHIRACSRDSSLKIVPQKTDKIETSVLATAVPRQDAGQNGSAPHNPMPGTKPTKDRVDVFSKSTTTFPKASDNSAGKSSVTVYSDGNPATQPPVQSPGSGVGPRVSAEAVKVKEMYDKCSADMKAGKFKFTKKMAATAPPGREAQVLKLKEKYGEDSPIPFQIAWHQANQGK